MAVMFSRMICCCLLLLVVAVGCGTTKSRTATQQLLLSSAVDDAIANIDFRPLAGHKVYFDTSYLRNVKGVGFVNAEYIISSLRQHMSAANCQLQASQDSADYIVEARVGTVGTDGNEIVYGMPASNGLSTAAALVPNAPPIPTIPEISLARKEAELGAAKIAVFAYDRETRRPIWQSGISQAKSSAQDFWVFGVGPFQRGSIYDKTQFAGQELRLPALSLDDSALTDPQVAYHLPYDFNKNNEARLAHRSKLNELLEGLPRASAEEWLVPLQPKITTDLEQRLEWR